MSVTTGTFPGVRIVDMPDLGAFTDNSSIVGEHAGSGRFAATALRTYMGRGIVNVLDQGANGDGVTDDTAALQAALTTYAGKAILFVPNTGFPYMSGPLTVPSNTDLIIEGTLKLRPSATNALLNIFNSSNITIRGYGTVDGNATAQAAGLGGGPIPLSASNVTNLTVRDITLQNSFYWNLNVTGSHMVRVDNVKMLGGNNANEFAVGCDDCWLTNCTIDGPAQDIGFSFYGGCTNCGAIGNVVKNSIGPGINVLADAGSPLACHNIVIADNIIHDVHGGGIGTETTNSAIHSGVVISGNRIDTVGLGNGSFVGIGIGSASDVTVVGNHVTRVGTQSALPQWGMYAGTTAKNVSFIGNHVYNIGYPGWGIGLYIDSTPGILASGNYFYDNQTTPTMVHAISGNCGTKNAFIGNYCTISSNIFVAADTVTMNAEVGSVYRYPKDTVVITSSPQEITNSAGFTRWFIGQGGNTESGSDTGSDFEIVACHDDGSLFAQPIRITRSSAVVTFSNPLTFANPLIVGDLPDDATAGGAGVPIGGMYRTGSVLKMRVA